jgi:hypothetical protein
LTTLLQGVGQLLLDISVCNQLFLILKTKDQIMAPSRITIRERILAVRARGVSGDDQVCKKYRISPRTLRRWAENINVYQDAMVAKANSMTLHSGPPREMTMETEHLMAIVNNMIISGRGIGSSNFSPICTSTSYYYA